VPHFVVIYAHPALGLVAVALVVRAAFLGLRSRQRDRHAGEYRAQHRALTPWAYVLVLVSWLGGLATVRFAREDMELAASGHFQAGSAVVTLLTAAALLSRWIGVDDRARRVHPWVGAAAALLAAVQVFLGLQLVSR